MTDQELLERIEQGKLHVCHETLDVHIYHGGFHRFILKKPDQHPDDGRWRFRFGERRRTIYRNRVVWLYFKRVLVPDTHFVDHVDRDRFNDHPSNLQLMSKKESYQQGFDKLQEANEWNWRCFWDYIEFMGHEPPPDSILWT